jgi:hypothetical protein
LEIDENGDWRATDGEISSLFPVQIYSQKQIFELLPLPRPPIIVFKKGLNSHSNRFFLPIYLALLISNERVT